jgi:hypothetical protein
VLRGALHDQEFSHGTVYKRNFSFPEKGAEPLREAGPETRIEIGKDGLVPGTFFVSSGCGRVVRWCLCAEGSRTITQVRPVDDVYPRFVQFVDRIVPPALFALADFRVFSVI